MKFDDFVSKQYGWSEPSLILGRALPPSSRDKAPGCPRISRAEVKLPLSMCNRHGIIAGATGTGKTRTLQLLAEQLSLNGVPVFIADVKGDLTGMSQPGLLTDKLNERCRLLERNFEGHGFPVEYLSLTGTHGIPIRATVSSFGPLLLGKVLELNEAQQSTLTVIFKICDDRHLRLLDLQDLRSVVARILDEGADLMDTYGGLSSSSVGVILRKIAELEAQGGNRFFAEPEFDIHDLVRFSPTGQGVLSILELSELQESPLLFSTFMMWLLATLYRDLPERRDTAKPALVFFFDEARFLFEGATKAFLREVDQVIRLIRSKGVGVFFVTQTPNDIPSNVLAQLGHRIQHALRAFTPNDAKALRATVLTFPRSPFYELENTLASLGTGIALVTVLAPDGVPTTPVVTMLYPPTSLIGQVDSEVLRTSVESSMLNAKYAHAMDREGARALSAAKIVGTPVDHGTIRIGVGPTKERSGAMLGTVLKVMDSKFGQAVGKEIVRGLVGILGHSKKRRRRH